MKQIVIDFSECRYPMELHSEIKTKLNLSEWYGNNLDALWDTLTGIIETPLDITIIFKPKTKGSETLRDYVFKIIEIFEEAAKSDDEISFSCETEKPNGVR